MYTAKEKKTITMEWYLCVRRRKKKPIPAELHLCMRRRKKNYSYRAVLVCTAKEKKLFGCLVGLGHLQGTQLLSGVMGRVGETSIYIRPSPGRGCGRLQPPLHW